MILQLPEMLARTLPGRFAASDLAVAAVYTTRPKYLVFERGSARPVCVVDTGGAPETNRRHAALQQLHARIPDLTAEPLACVPCEGERAMHVESGLAGIPWFALGRTFQTHADWHSVAERAAAALRAFHAAVRDIPEWSEVVAPGDELRRQLFVALARRMPLREEACALIDARAQALDALGKRRYPWQHGDFSLNNLLVDRKSVGIIDFEELGDTCMPLHDEIGLAISVGLTYPQAPLSVAECFNTCVFREADEQGLQWEQVEGLVLHHLLFRINGCAATSRRAALAALLSALLQAFTAHPRAFMSSPAGWSTWLAYQSGS
jgi:aminoglycoside phosphotransferase (APT) family kinase protein